MAQKEEETVITKPLNECTIEEIEAYLDKLGYIVLTEKEYNLMEEVIRNHPG